MKFGVNLTGLIQFTADRDPREQFSTILEWTHAAAELGYDYIYTGQHYLTHPYKAFQAVPLLSRLAGETGDLHLGMTLVLPLHHPIQLAEHLATMDVVSSGRLFLSAAAGYRTEEFEAFGLDPAQRGARFREGLDLLRMLWTQESVTFHGAHFSVEDARIPLKPVQQPHPPIWVAANGDKAVARAARMGLPWHLNPHATRPTLARQVAVYRETADSAGVPPVGLALNRELYCAASSDRAWDEAGPYVARKYETYADWGQDRELPEGDRGFRDALQDLARDRFVIGSPEECIDDLERYADLDIGAMHFRMGWPGMPSQLARRNLQLFAEEVVPALRERLAMRQSALSPFEVLAPAAG